MRLIWLEDAAHDLIAIRHYIEKDNIAVAKRVAKKIIDAVEVLLTHSDLGRPGRVVNTRELIVSQTPYIIPYRAKNNVIEILRVFHSAMQWPDRL